MVVSKYVFNFTPTWEMIQFDQYFSSGLKPPTRISWYHMISIDAMHSHLWVKSSQLGVRWLQRHFLCCFKILTCQLSKSHRKKHVFVGMFCSMGICSSFLEWQVFSHAIFLQLTSRMSTKKTSMSFKRKVYTVETTINKFWGNLQI